MTFVFFFVRVTKLSNVARVEKYKHVNAAIKGAGFVCGSMTRGNKCSMLLDAVAQLR